MGSFGSWAYSIGHVSNSEDCFGIFEGGLNPRVSGAASKMDTNFAVELLAARGRGDRSLSTPHAAGGGGRRPGSGERHPRAFRQELD